MGKVIAYTDGSFTDVDKPIIGWAYVILDEEENIIHQDSGKIDDRWLDHRNITGECKAVVEALDWCENNGHTEVDFYIDYIGCKHWAEKTWKTKNEMTIAYQGYVTTSPILKGLTFTHVKGHSGNKFNDMVDVMAREAMKG